MLGPSLATKTRVALVGTGIRGVNMWGKNVRENYSDVVEIVGLSDINPGRLAFAKRHIGASCPTFTDFDEMLAKTKPERVIVTTMDSTHHDLIVCAMEAGANVITEKPLTTDETKCQAILDARARTGRDITVTHNYRYSPHRERMKQLLVEGRIGRLTSVDFHCIWIFITAPPIFAVGTGRSVSRARCSCTKRVITSTCSIGGLARSPSSFMPRGRLSITARTTPLAARNAAAARTGTIGTSWRTNTSSTSM